MQGRKRRWTKDELELLRQAEADPEQLRTLAELSGRSIQALRDKLHRLRKSAKQSARTPSTPTQSGRPDPPTPDPEPASSGGGPVADVARLHQEMDELRRQFEAVKDAFEELAEQLRAHMHSFGAWLVEVGQAYLQGIRPVGIQDVVAENRRLKFELDTLRSVLKRQEEMVVEQLRELELLVEQFTHLGSLQKVAALGDFLPRLRVLVDKFGAVVEARRVIPALETLGPGADSLLPPASAPPASDRLVGGSR